MKKHLKNIIPRAVFTRLSVIYQIIINAPYDYNKMLSFNRTARDTQQKLIGEIIQGYHSIEKGLTMPNRRLGFGQASIILLVKNINDYLVYGSSKNKQFIHAISVINEYINIHKKKNFKLDTKTINSLDKLPVINIQKSKSTQISLTQTDYFKNSKLSFDLFSNSRHSVRNFSDKNIEIDVLKKAIELAQNAPSACNRQSSRVNVYSNKEKINKLLKIQGGNRGFGHLTNKLIIVTSDWSGFDGVRERFAPWVDGGIFSLNLVYALHFHKIATCMLNCNLIKEQDKELSIEANIPNSENIIVMIACGNIKNEFMLAASKRYDANFITRIH